jgi:hypothetical protein
VLLMVSPHQAILDRWRASIVEATSKALGADWVRRLSDASTLVASSKGADRRAGIAMSRPRADAISVEPACFVDDIVSECALLAERCARRPLNEEGLSTRSEYLNGAPRNP